MLSILIAMVLAAAAPAWADAAGSDARFDALDRNGDGFVSRDEGKDAEELNTRFSELDVNNDGKLSRAEYRVLERERREAATKDAQKPQASSRRRSSAAGASQ